MVMVVVMELFSLVTSAICVRMSGDGLEVTRVIHYISTGLMFSSAAAFLPQWLRGDRLHFSLLRTPLVLD